MNQTGTVVRGFQTASISKQSSAGSRRFRFRMGRAVAAGAMALALLGGAIRSYATNYVWIADSGAYSTGANWNQGTFAGNGDSVFFTNNDNFTVTVDVDTANIKDTIVSNQAGVFTLDCSSHTYTTTNDFRVGYYNSTSTVYVTASGGGTLAVDDSGANGIANAQLRVADTSTNDPTLASCVAVMVITQGTVVADIVRVGCSSNSVGSIYVGHGGILQNVAANIGTYSIGDTSPGNSLIVSNGGQFSCGGTFNFGGDEFDSNNVVIVSDPGSSGYINGYFRGNANSCTFILSNSATLHDAGSFLFGLGSSYCTGSVCGAGTQLIIDNGFQQGSGSAGGTNNFFSVYDGAYISAQGTVAVGNNAYHIHDGLAIGGIGRMSTGLFTVVRSASNQTNHDSNFLMISNAYVQARYLNPQGPVETWSILGKATVLLTNNLGLGVVQGSSNAVSMNANNGTFVVDGGTIIAQVDGANTAGNFGLGGSGPNNTVIFTNGAKIYISGGQMTATNNLWTVSGSSTVWSNFNRVANYTNDIDIGSGACSNNVFIVSDGAKLYNSGTFEVGGVCSGGYSHVFFGGPGLPAVIDNTQLGGTIHLGSATVTFGTTFLSDANTLNISNATVNAAALMVGASLSPTNTLTVDGGNTTVGFLQVLGANSAVFNGGQMNVGSASFAANANFGSPFVIGNGTAAAIYNMSPAGGIHAFATGLTVNNGATLEGSGAIAGNVTSYGTIVPNISITGNLSLQPGSAINLGFPNGSDNIAVSGALSLGGVLNVGSLSGFGVGSYTVLTFGSLAGTGSLGLGTTPGGGFVYAIVTNGSAIQLSVSTSTPAMTYGGWQSYYYPGGGPSSAGTADPSGSGMLNTNRFLAGFGTNLTATLHIISIAKAQTTNVVITYLGANGDSSYSGGPSSRTNVLEFTTGATGGNYTNNFVSANQTNVLSSGTGIGLLSSFIDTNGAASGSTRYYRVRVIVP